MVMMNPVDRALGIRNSDDVVLAHHLPIIVLQSVLVLVVILVKLYHRELLLQRARSVLFCNRSLMLHIVVPPLIV